MSTAVLRSEDALKSRFHANAFAYRPSPPQHPPMNPRRRKSPPPPRPSAAAAAAATATATSPPPHKPPSRSPPPKPGRPAAARSGRKPRPVAGDGGENDGGSADDLRHHGRRLVMEEVMILKRGEAMKPSPPVLPRSNRLNDPSISPTVPIDIDRKRLGIPLVDPVYAGPGFSTLSPPASSLPFPSFLQTPLAASEEATRSLLRLLRLNQFDP